MINVFELRHHPETTDRFKQALELEVELDDLVASIGRTAGLHPSQVMSALIAARSEDRVAS